MLREFTDNNDNFNVMSIIGEVYKELKLMNLLDLLAEINLE